MQRQKRRQEKHSVKIKSNCVVIIDGTKNSNTTDARDEEMLDEVFSVNGETVELALTLPERSRSTITDSTAKLDSTSAVDSDSQIVDDHDSTLSLAVTIEDLEEMPSGCCYRMKGSNFKIDHLVSPKPPPRSFIEKLALMSKWTLWAVTSCLHLFLLVVNIGATIQQNVVRAALPGTFEQLYPDNYASSTMCAWDEASPHGTIQTFETLEDVKAANFTVIHCGACGACSNWNDLSLQWTTRTFLAEEAQKCTKKSLFGGTVEDVQSCNEDDIGFSEECATCWTKDELCAKRSCVFIFLQSVIVNQVSNFNVELGDITTATCDEALCGPEFVPCSGATRRRMNIISDIPRPVDQQCTVAQGNWTNIFNHP